MLLTFHGAVNISHGVCLVFINSLLILSLIIDMLNILHRAELDKKKSSHQLRVQKQTVVVHVMV